jgi:hypothetical protein
VGVGVEMEGIAERSGQWGNQQVGSVNEAEVDLLCAFLGRLSLITTCLWRNDRLPISTILPSPFSSTREKT